MKIFSGASNKPLAQKVAKNLGLQLSGLEIFVFPDGEKRIRILDKVLDEDVVVVQSTSPEPDKSYMELFFIVDALKRSGANRIKAVIPYLGYQRQDHVFRDGEAVSLEVITTLLKWGGVDDVVSFDLHSIRIPEIFEIKLSHLSALSIFADKIREIGGDAVLVSPDMGGIRRIKILSKMLNNMPFVIIKKDRDLATGKVTTSGIDGEVKENAIIVDDMISTGRTITGASDLLKKNGAKNIYVFATHAVFSDKAPKILQESGAEKIYVTDTIFVP
ncbi:MAG: ribose-phosphate pyrophosphokinase, partial [Candidatus Levybacteria bacterium]|nr:ribose-phosphate pyrophosphokinase [Candidatus Levybacteria bacterium]